MSKHTRSIAPTLLLALLSCSDSVAQAQPPQPAQNLDYGSAIVATAGGLMQACGETYPARKAEYQARLQRLIVKTFGDGPEAQAKYNTLMADERVQEGNRNMVAEIKGSDPRGEEFAEACERAWASP